MQMSHTADQLITAARELNRAVEKLRFGRPVSHVYNPLNYAWPAHEMYLRRFGGSPKKIVFVGMNPGPFGMVQTGIPFGEIGAVRDWLGIQAQISPPQKVHPRRPVLGFECPRSEVSGQRLWKLFSDRYGAPEKFFAEHFVVNYCPLAFLELSGRNLTPDKLSVTQAKKLFAACDTHFREVLRVLQPEWVIGVGDFAARRARLVLEGFPVRIGQILHPSPASPAANRNWAGAALAQMKALGAWK